MQLMLLIPILLLGSMVLVESSTAAANKVATSALLFLPAKRRTRRIASWWPPSATTMPTSTTVFRNQHGIPYCRPAVPTVGAAPRAVSHSAKPPLLLCSVSSLSSLFSSADVEYSESEQDSGDILSSSSSSSSLFSSKFPHTTTTTDRPHLALITMRCSADSDAHTEAALQQLHKAVTTTGGGCVDLVSVRVNVPSPSEQQQQHDLVQQRVTRMVQQLVAWSDQQQQQHQQQQQSSSSCTWSGAFRVVVSSDWLDAGLRAGAHGVHFKETHRDRIPAARAWFNNKKQQSNSSNNNNTGRRQLLVGTSTHSVSSALDAVARYQPDYFFCGTCFATESHPEKTGDDLEGPALPAQVAQALQQQQQHQQHPIPKVLAIGGLNVNNCRNQVTNGFYVENARADGIAIISAVLESDRPDEAVWQICANMRKGMGKPC